MALLYSILTILDDSCCSGYELWKKSSEDTTYYWKASQQQIYRELSKLEALEAVSSKVIPQNHRPDKKIYSLTNKGKNMLVSWNAQPTNPKAIREEVLVKILAAHLASPKTIVEELQRIHQIHIGHLLACKQKEQECFASQSELSLKQKCEYLTLRWGIRYETGWVDWCEEAISMLQSE